MSSIPHAREHKRVYQVCELALAPVNRPALCILLTIPSVLQGLRALSGEKGALRAGISGLSE